MSLRTWRKKQRRCRSRSWRRFVRKDVVLTQNSCTCNHRGSDPCFNTWCVGWIKAHVQTFDAPVDVFLWLIQIKSNLGRLILKEEKEKAVHFRRKTQSLPDRTHMHTSKTAGGFFRFQFVASGWNCFQDVLFFINLQVCHSLHQSLLHTRAQVWPE